MMNNFLQQIPSELLQLLAEIGYVGVNNGFFKESQAIFDAVVKARPDSLDALLAQGIGHIFSGQIANGSKILFKVLEKNPENELAKSFLAIAFKMTHVDSHAVAAAESVVKYGENPSAKQLAQALLDTYQKELSPMDLQTQQASQFSKTSHSPS
jgi:tetratricopeptide (TPR) repeat protein